MEKQRNYNLDTLRTLATILVVLLHVSASYVIRGSDTNTFDFNFWIANFIDSFTRISVPVFVMISGYFLYGKTEPYRLFYKKRARKILVPLIFWSIFYLIFNFSIKGNHNFKDLIYSVLKGAPFYHLWYVYMLIGLYLCIPFLNKYTFNLKTKSKWLLAIAFLCIGIILNLVDEYYRIKPVFIFWFINYIGYFMLGSLLKKTMLFHKKVALFIYIVSSLSVVVFSYYTMSVKGNLYFYDYLSPFVIISSLAFFKYFIHLTISINSLSKIAHLTFGIYLIHPAIEYVLKMFLKYFDVYTANSIIGIAVQFCFIFSISFCVVFIMYKSKYLRKLI